MARVKISEYAAKKLLLGDEYLGVSIQSHKESDEMSLKPGKYVIKVDTGVKKRFLNDLVVLNVSADEVRKVIKKFLEQGHQRILIEPFLEHDNKGERYISATLTREGVEIINSQHGGIEVEKKSDDVQITGLTREVFLQPEIPKNASLIEEKIIIAMKQCHACFIEINPYIESQNSISILDVAMELDSAKLQQLPAWINNHVQFEKEITTIEQNILALNTKSTASFSLTIFNENASVFPMLSGGGASLVVLDSFVQNKIDKEIAHYSEYSGGPSRDETCAYAREIIKVLIASKAQKKVLLIAGGVANFTDVQTTFLGIADACLEFIDELQKQNVTVVIRRGGPRQKEGLTYIKDFFTNLNILVEVFDSKTPLNQVATCVKKYI